MQLDDIPLILGLREHGGTAFISGVDTREPARRQKKAEF